MLISPSLTVTGGSSSPPVVPPAPPLSPPVSLPGHTFAIGDALYQNATGWHKALNNAQATLGFYLVIAITPNDFTLAIPGQVVSGYVGLISGEWYHTSPTTAGAIVAVGLDPKPVGAFAANPIGQARSPTELVYFPIIPYQP